MSKRSGIAILIINTLLCLFIALGTVFLMSGWGIFVKIACYVAAGIGTVAVFLFFFLKKTAFFKTAFILVVCAAIAFAVTFLLNEIGHLNDYKTDEERVNALIEIIRGAGVWSMAVYVVIQILQVVILPLPAVVCYVPGAAVFGPFQATLLASLGVLIGSVINYFIGKFFGKKVVTWVAGKETTEKYTAYFARRGKIIFLLMQILPFFPDDILCMVAGLTSMNFAYFSAVIVLVRPLIIAVYCFTFNGTIIPFEGWGIAVWIAIFAVCIILAVLSFKYQDKFENWLVKKFSKKTEAESDTENCSSQDDFKSEK